MDRQFGLIGKSLGHSFSKAFFTDKFAQEGISAVYDNFELSSLDEFPELVLKKDFSGLNITIPYKEAILPYLDALDDEAREIGAVNTISFRNGKMIGHNTDAFGFHQSIKPFFRNIHERALILGTGGASKAVAHKLRQLGVDVCFLSRNPKNSNEFSYSECNALMLKAFKFIVNTTPLGTYPNTDEFPPIPLDSFTPDHLVVDLIYNPEKTKLLQAAEEQGADSLNGLSMLKHQALKAWEIWNNHE